MFLLGFLMAYFILGFITVGFLIGKEFPEFSKRGGKLGLKEICGVLKAFVLWFPLLLADID